MPVLGVIPARLDSSRLPGKPLLPLAGEPLILWVVRRVAEASLCDRLVVATDARLLAVEASTAQRTTAIDARASFLAEQIAATEARASLLAEQIAINRRAKERIRRMKPPCNETKNNLYNTILQANDKQPDR